MKKIVFLALFCMGFLFASAQKDTTLYGYNDSVALKQVEIGPAFPGGPATWHRYLVKNLYYTNDQIPISIENIVNVQFIVEADGKPTEIKIVKSVDPIKDRKAISLVKNFPWMPAVQNGERVRCRTSIEIQFQAATSE